VSSFEFRENRRSERGISFVALLNICTFLLNLFSDLGVVCNKNFDVLLTVHVSLTLANDQLDAKILIHLLQSSTCTCFEQYLAHPQEVKLY